MEPPTEKQVAYLKKKGKEIPATKKEASELISSLIPNSGSQGSFQKREIDTTALSVDAEQKADIIGFVEGCVPRLIIALAETQKLCKAAGITENPAIGMIFNQVCEQRRFER
jgi:hypothetical protein